MVLVDFLISVNEMEDSNMNNDVLDFLKTNDGKFYSLLFSGILLWGIHKGVKVKWMGLEVELGNKYELTRTT